MTEACLFCRIVAGEIESDLVLETPTTIAFRDIRPVAPVHVLVVPRAHLGSLSELGPEHRGLTADLLGGAVAVARSEGIFDSGYRVVVNVGRDGGQMVGHLHLHVIGGRELRGLP
ncbi:MAG: histidine triad nucleotide-binding protein [Acidimicrobiia bacterium]